MEVISRKYRRFLLFKKQFARAFNPTLCIGDNSFQLGVGYKRKPSREILLRTNFSSFKSEAAYYLMLQGGVNGKKPLEKIGQVLSPSVRGSQFRRKGFSCCLEGNLRLFYSGGSMKRLRYSPSSGVRNDHYEGELFEVGVNAEVASPIAERLPKSNCVISNWICRQCTF